MKNNNNCDLELRLRPSLDDYPDLSVSSANGSSVHPHAEMEVSSKIPEHQQRTIFYNGKESVSEEVTELQARAIIMLASSDVAGGRRIRTSSLESSKFIVCSNNNLSPAGLSMKRSLQRFFQKRHQRIQLSSPYSHPKPCSFFS